MTWSPPGPVLTVGFVLSTGTLGTCLASFAVARVRERLGFGASWIGAFTLCGTAVLCLGLSASVLVVGVLAAVTLFCTSIAGTCSMSLRQEVTPNHLLGRVTAAFWTTHSALGPLGAGVITAAAAGGGATATCLGIGIRVVCIALTGY